jgi:hypothetical protein
VDSRTPRRLDPRAVRTRVLDVLLRAAGPGVKAGVLNRAVQLVGREILRSSLTSKDPVHFGALAGAFAVNDLHDPLSEHFVLAVSRYVLRGQVLPVQRLLEVIDEAGGAFLARCPCRAAGRVRDLESREPAPGADDEALLRGILDAWDRRAARAETDPRLAAVLDDVAQAHRAGAAGGTLDALFAGVWPYWEILLEHERYDRCWIEGLTKNQKTWAVSKPVLRAWVRAVYDGRGVVFTHMEVGGLPYCVCTCPGPEADGGCILTNWHYASGNDEILIPNAEQAYGQRRDVDGAVLPCGRHPARAGRPCLGCGCPHERPRSGPADR